MILNAVACTVGAFLVAVFIFFITLGLFKNEVNNFIISGLFFALCLSLIISGTIFEVKQKKMTEETTEIVSVTITNAERYASTRGRYGGIKEIIRLVTVVSDDGKVFELMCEDPQTFEKFKIGQQIELTRTQVKKPKVGWLREQIIISEWQAPDMSLKPFN